DDRIRVAIARSWRWQFAACVCLPASAVVRRGGTALHCELARSPRGSGPTALKAALQNPVHSRAARCRNIGWRNGGHQRKRLRKPVIWDFLRRSVKTRGGAPRLELGTSALSGLRSNDWAMRPRSLATELLRQPMAGHQEPPYSKIKT